MRKQAEMVPWQGPELPEASAWAMGIGLRERSVSECNEIVIRERRQVCSHGFPPEEPNIAKRAWTKACCCDVACRSTLIGQRCDRRTNTPYFAGWIDCAQHRRAPPAASRTRTARSRRARSVARLPLGNARDPRRRLANALGLEKSASPRCTQGACFQPTGEQREQERAEDRCHGRVDRRQGYRCCEKRLRDAHEGISARLTAPRAAGSEGPASLEHLGSVHVRSANVKGQAAGSASDRRFPTRSVDWNPDAGPGPSSARWRTRCASTRTQSAASSCFRSFAARPDRGSTSPMRRMR